MTDTAPAKETTLRLKQGRKPKGYEVDKPLEVLKNEKADLHERRPPKKPKDYKLQYRGKPDGLMAKSHPDWKFLEAFHTVELASAYGKARMNGNSLHRMFDYRILDKDGKECPIK